MFFSKLGRFKTNYVVIFWLIVAIVSSFDPTGWKIPDKPGIEEPTPSEIMRALAKKGHECWGQQMRIDGNIRLLMIGGSQTAELERDGSGFSLLIHEHLQKNYGPSSYALNRGRGSTQPKSFIGAKYDFEEWETSKWPNCVMLDFTLNTLPHDGWNAARDVEKIIRSIKYKYLVRDLPIPDFFMIEYLMIMGFYLDDLSGRYNSSQLRYKRLNSLSHNITDSFFAGNGFDRGCANCAFLSELADYHGYPVVSIRNAIYPAFQRFHLEMKPNAIDVHYLSADGIHLSIWGRCFAMNYIMAPFFKRIMQPRKEIPVRSKYSAIYDADLSMFAVEPINLDLIRWSSWGAEQNSLKNITVEKHLQSSLDVSKDEIGDSRPKRGLWKFMPTLHHEDDDTHYCYGSNVDNSIGLFNIVAPLECNTENPCALQVSAVHSWNKTHYGDMTCNLYGLTSHSGLSSGSNGKSSAPGRKNHVKLSSVTIAAQVYNGTVLRNTQPLDTVLHDNLHAGHYSLQCNKLDSRYSCIAAIRISQVLLI